MNDGEPPLWMNRRIGAQRFSALPVGRLSRASFL